MVMGYNIVTPFIYTNTYKLNILYSLIVINFLTILIVKKKNYLFKYK